MKIEINELNAVSVTVSIYDILQNATPEQIWYVVESLSCHEKVIECVAMQLVEGLTENGFCGATHFGSYPSALMKARELIAAKHSYASERTINALRSNINQLKMDVAYWREQYEKAWDEKK